MKLVKRDVFPFDLCTALRETVFLIEGAMRIKGDSRKGGDFWNTGSTFNAAVVGPDGKVVVANVGDSRAILSQEKRIISQTKDHNPIEEKKRIADVGGEVIWFGGAWRVNGEVAMSRSFGDCRHGDALFPEPDIYEWNLNKQRWIILGTDGFWNYFDSRLEREKRGLVEDSWNLITSKKKERGFMALPENLSDRVVKEWYKRHPEEAPMEATIACMRESSFNLGPRAMGALRTWYRGDDISVIILAPQRIGGCWCC
jgi:serine/threonine protein phosphatase PrpC